jgi:SpoIID/LytB domain protein
LIPFDREPSIKAGLVTGARTIRLSLEGGFRGSDGGVLPAGDYTVTRDGVVIRLKGAAGATEAPAAISIEPLDFDSARFSVQDVKIGIDFHWERSETQTFQGSIHLVHDAEGITLINVLPLEAYLISVISSEMNAACPPELLSAHAVVSRSWLLAQISREPASGTFAPPIPDEKADEIIRWYGRENHSGFDVCADDHCQRYQGISKAFSASVFQAINDTRGRVLIFDDEICDARYSKSCGGMTDVYSSAWEDHDVPYLPSVYDGDGTPSEYDLPLTVEKNAVRWIGSSPPAFCGTASPELIKRILPGFDQETQDFYRWRTVYSNEDLRAIIGARMGSDPGPIRGLTPLARGPSGRIIKLRIEGERRTVVIGKELEIRRVLSRSHLYSSAFVVEALEVSRDGFPARFALTGAGWGHGVGLCQIGAAVMADRGSKHLEILAHYFDGARVERIY